MINPVGPGAPSVPSQGLGIGRCAMSRSKNETKGHGLSFPGDRLRRGCRVGVSRAMEMCETCCLYGPNAGPFPGKARPV